MLFMYDDALTNYISALNFPNIDDNKYKNFWPADIHIIEKDILRFHAVFGLLLAAKLPTPKKCLDMDGYFQMIKKCQNRWEYSDPLDIIEKYG